MFLNSGAEMRSINLYDLNILVYKYIMIDIF